MFFKRTPPREHPVATARVELRDPKGLNPRVALTVAAVGSRMRSKITVESTHRVANATDVGALLLLGASCGEIVVVRCEGEDAAEALQATVTALEGVPAGG